MIETNSPSARLSGRRLTAARIVWAVLALACLLVFVWGVVERSQQPVNEGCQFVECNPIEFTEEDLKFLQGESQSLGWVWNATALVWNLTYLGAAALIVSRRSDDWIALLVSFTLLALGGVAFSSANSVLLVTQPQLSPLVNLLEALGYFTLLFLLLTFPDGRFTPRWTRWTFPFLLLIFLPDRFALLGVIAVLGYLSLTIYSRVYRYRNVSDALQRQQTKWVAVGLASQLVIMGSWLFISASFPASDPTIERTTVLLILLPVVLVLGSLFPISVTVAILRYRLWDIDLVINRTLVYGTLTGLLVLVYFLSVLLFQFLFRSLTGQESPLAIVASTLVIAALFNPLRRRIQSVIDRRLYRRRYDATLTLEALGTKLRDEVDLAELSGSLLDTVEGAVQPAHLSLWLRDTE